MKKAHPFVPHDWHLIKAVMDGDMPAAKSALANGANINGVDSKGKTALHWAAHNGDTRMIGFLASKGANVFVQDDRDSNAVLTAAAAGKKDTVQQLLDLKVPPHMRDEMKETALHLALSNGHKEVADLLLEDSPFLATFSGQANMQPLHVAAQQPGMTALMEKIKARGARLDEKDMFGFTPLHRAVLGNNMPAVEWLVEEGANYNAVDIHGITPLGIADDKNLTDIKAYLKDAPEHRRHAQETRRARKQAEVTRAREELLRPFGEGTTGAIAIKKPLKPLTRKKPPAA